jgi:hypothetical protein
MKKKILNYRVFEQKRTEREELVERIAKLYSEKLKQELTPEELTQAIKDNRSEEMDGVCHTHDYIDANMVMLEAMEEIMGEGYCDDIPVDQEKTLLWNDSWKMAFKNEYYHTV